MFGATLQVAGLPECPHLHSTGQHIPAGLFCQGTSPRTQSTRPRPALSFPCRSQRPPAATAAAEVPGQAVKELRPATSYSSWRRQPSFWAHEPFFRPAPAYAWRVFLRLVEPALSLQRSCLDPPVPSAAVAAHRPGSCLSAPTSAQREQGCVCAAATGVWMGSFSRVPARHWLSPPPAQQTSLGRAALLINSPLPASPHLAHTFACSCLLGPSLVQSPEPGRRRRGGS